MRCFEHIYGVPLIYQDTKGDLQYLFSQMHETPAFA